MDLDNALDYVGDELGYLETKRDYNNRRNLFICRPVTYLVEMRGRGNLGDEADKKADDELVHQIVHWLGLKDGLVCQDGHSSDIRSGKSDKLRS